LHQTYFASDKTGGAFKRDLLTIDAIIRIADTSACQDNDSSGSQVQDCRPPTKIDRADCRM